MPVCRRCSAPFPNRIVLDGVIKNIHSRRYCLACSPWGGHNTRAIGQVISGRSLTCQRCGRAYSYHWQHRRSSSATYCSACRSQEQFKARKARAVAYKGGKCERCGYDRLLAALEFHHRDPASKEGNLGHFYRRSWARMRDELDKCILVCANCHREVHASLAQFGQSGSVT